MNRATLSCAVLATVLVGGPAMATSGVSGIFDGTYAGSIEPASVMSSPACPRFSVALPIASGTFKTSGTATEPALEGFVTAEGFVSGHMQIPGNATLTFEGRITDAKLSAGVIDDHRNCAWTANLAKVQ